MKFKAFKLILLIAAVLLAGSCAKKKPPRTIVTKITVPAVRNEVTAMADESTERRFEWDGVYYSAAIARTADKDLPVVSDADGNRYYDNRIKLTVSGPNGTLLNRTFGKADFAEYVNARYVQPSGSALLNIVFHEVRGGKAMFIATIGSPDERDDVYMPVELGVTKSGGVSMAKMEEIE